MATRGETKTAWHLLSVCSSVVRFVVSRKQVRQRGRSVLLLLLLLVLLV